MSARTRELLSRWQRGGYLSLLLLLLTIVAALPALLDDFPDIGCPVSPPSTPPVSGSVGGGIIPGYEPEVVGLISGTDSPVLGRQTVSRVLSISTTSTAPLSVEIRYMGVNSAYNLMFTGHQPRNPAGPAPYVWENIPIGPFERRIGVSYIAPEPANQLSSVNFEDMFLVRTPSGHEYYWVKPLRILKPGLSAGSEESSTFGETDARESDVARTLFPENAASSYSWWVSHFWFGLGAGTKLLTTDLCQSSVNYLRGGGFFIAIRVPDAAGENDSNPVAMPFRYDEPGHYPRLDLLDETVYPAVPVVSLPLVVSTDWRRFALNQLPAASGEHWVVLQPSASGQTNCPANLNLSAWEFYCFLPIDAGPSLMVWNEKVLPAYFCFETGSPPPFASVLSETLGLAGHEEAGVFDTPVTAMGPFPIRLAGGSLDPPYFVSGPQLARAQPSSRLQLRFLVQNTGSAIATITLSTTSTLHLPWRIFRGLYDKPDLTMPVTGNVTLNRGVSAPIWLVVDVPSGAYGAETVILTASSTSPTRSTWNSGLVWFGSLPTVRRIHRHLNPR
jgi:hypothetical protein